MAKGKRTFTKEEAPVATTEEVEETTAEVAEEVVEETPVAKEEAPVVTNVVADVIAVAEAVPGPEVKLEIPPTLAEVAATIEEGDTVEISGIRNFEGIVGKVSEIRPDGYIVVRAAAGTYAAPKANVKKVK